MARMTINIGDGFELQMEQLINEQIGKEVVWAGAQPVANQIRENLKGNLTNSKTSDGALLDSLGIAPPLLNDKGIYNTKIGFKGYDKKGVANALKARVMESGSSYVKKRPFIRTAVRKTEAIALLEMQRKYNELIEQR